MVRALDVNLLIQGTSSIIREIYGAQGKFQRHEVRNKCDVIMKSDSVYSTSRWMFLPTPSRYHIC